MSMKPKNPPKERSAEPEPEGQAARKGHFFGIWLYHLQKNPAGHDSIALELGQ